MNVEKLNSGFYLVESDGIVIRRKYRPSPRWDKIWMATAREKSQLTRCASRGFGSVIVADYRFEVSSGFNGPPIGTKHPQDRHPEKKQECPRRYFGFASSDGDWVCPCGHAERSAIAFAARLGKATEDRSMYLYGDPPALPCLDCAIDIIQAGITELVVDSLEQYEKRLNAVNVADLLREGNVLIRKPSEEEL